MRRNTIELFDQCIGLNERMNDKEIMTPFRAAESLTTRIQPLGLLSHWPGQMDGEPTISFLLILIWLISIFSLTFIEIGIRGRKLGTRTFILHGKKGFFALSIDFLLSTIYQNFSRKDRKMMVFTSFSAWWIEHEPRVHLDRRRSPGG